MVSYPRIWRVIYFETESDSFHSLLGWGFQTGTPSYYRISAFRFYDSIALNISDIFKNLVLLFSQLWTRRLVYFINKKTYCSIFICSLESVRASNSESNSLSSSAYALLYPTEFMHKEKTWAGLWAYSIGVAEKGEENFFPNGCWAIKVKYCVTAPVSSVDITYMYGCLLTEFLIPIRTQVF